jgi:predicted nicotinamide N-methyase
MDEHDVWYPQYRNDLDESVAWYACQDDSPTFSEDEFAHLNDEHTVRYDSNPNFGHDPAPGLQPPCKILPDGPQSSNDTASHSKNSDEDADEDSEDDVWYACHDLSPRFDEDSFAPQYRKDLDLPILGTPLRVVEDQRLGIAGHAWPGGRALLSYLAVRLDLLRDRRVVELGAGTGLLGIGCDLLLRELSPASQHSIVVTDVGAAVPLMQQNVVLNSAWRTRATELTWGRTNVHELGIPVDVIVMAEVAYIRETFCDLATTISELSGPNTVVLHGYHHREACASRLFLDELAKLGFTHEELESREGATIFRHHPPQFACT